MHARRCASWLVDDATRGVSDVRAAYPASRKREERDRWFDLSGRAPPFGALQMHVPVRRRIDTDSVDVNAYRIAVGAHQQFPGRYRGLFLDPSSADRSALVRGQVEQLPRRCLVPGTVVQEFRGHELAPHQSNVIGHANVLR